MSGYTPSNPIVIEDEDEDISSAIPSRPLFKPRFKPIDPQKPPTQRTPHPMNYQTCASSRDILSSAIFDRCISNAQVSPAIVQALKQSCRFKYLLKDLIAFVRTVENYSQRPHSTRQSSPKRRRTNNSAAKVPPGAENWNIPFPFPDGEAPPGYFEEWRSKHAKKLMEEFVILLQIAQKSINKENSLNQPNMFGPVSSKHLAEGVGARKLTELNAAEKSPALGLDQLWTILRDFNPQTAASTPPLSAPSEASLDTTWSPLNAEEEGLSTAIPKIATGDSPEAAIDLQSDPAYALQFGSPFTKHSHENAALDGLNLSGLGPADDLFLNLEQGKIAVDDIDFDDITALLNSLNSQQHPSEGTNAEFGSLFDSASLPSANPPSSYAATEDWIMAPPSANANLGLDHVEDLFLDWQMPFNRDLPIDPVLLTDVTNQNYPNASSPTTLTTLPNPNIDQTSYNPIQIPPIPEFTFDHSIFAPSTSTEPTSSVPPATLERLGSPSQNSSINRKRAVMSKVPAYREALVADMDKVKRLLWNLTIEASVLQHVLVGDG